MNSDTGGLWNSVFTLPITEELFREMFNALRLRTVTCPKQQKACSLRSIFCLSGHRGVWNGGAGGQRAELASY